MVSRNRIEEFYSSSKRECCSNCGQPFGGDKGWYLDRGLYCKLCYEDELDWRENAEERDSAEEKTRLIYQSTTWTFAVSVAVFVLVAWQILLEFFL